jgi:hypothetical protein
VCQYCGTSRPRNWVIEHVIPESRGGHNEAYNLVLACQSCNNRKRSAVWVPTNIAVLELINPEWGARIREMAAEDAAHPRPACKPMKSYRLHRSLTREFARWAFDHEMTESEAAERAFRLLMSQED